MAGGHWSQEPTLQPHILTQHAEPELDRWTSPGQNVNMPEKENKENLKAESYEGQQY